MYAAHVLGCHLKVVRAGPEALPHSPLLLQIIQAETQGRHAEVLAAIEFEQAESMFRKFDGPHQAQKERAQHLLWRVAVMHREAKGVTCLRLRFVPPEHDADGERPEGGDDIIARDIF